MLFDGFWLLLIHLGKFIPRPSFGPKQFVQLRMNCLSIPMLSPLNE
jgi:hypothetical protein